MKKTLLLGITGLMSFAGVAQEITEPEIVLDAYAIKVTPDGTWMGCYGASALIYNTKTGEARYIEQAQLGLGNAMSLEGVGVGYQGELGAIFTGKNAIVPVPLRDKEMSSINGITPDGCRITGYVTNPELEDYEGDIYDDNITRYVPFYCDIDSDGTVGPVNYLPYPETDLLGDGPQYVVGVWISDDGKTIGGTMTDSYGRMEVPVVFSEDENGVWSYSLPSKPLFNPDGVVIPENPWTEAPSEPNFKDYMDPEQYEIYLEWIGDFLAGEATQPDPFELMTEEQEEAYLEAYDEYVEYYIEHDADFKAYDEAYVKILSTSPLFGEITVNPQGTMLASAASYYGDDTRGSNVYIFDIESGEYTVIKSKITGLNVTQLLKDGTLIARTGLFSYEVAQTYILLPGAEEFIKIEDFLQTSHPDYVAWMDKTIPISSGYVSVSEDFSTIVGGLEFLSLADPNMYPDVTILSYIFSSNQQTGIESLEDLNNKDNLYHVFNLQGVKVLETKNSEDIRNLAKGIYIINGKKVKI